jgi:porin
MDLEAIRPRYLFLAALLLVTAAQPGMAQEVQTAADTVRQQFGGPNSVPGQLADDARLEESLTGRTLFGSYFDWKDQLREKSGLDFSLDYTAGITGATNTLGEDDAFAGGAVRFFGRWDLVGRSSGNTGTFVWKLEHRHKYTSIPPSGTAAEIGYVGVILPVLSNIGMRLTNLYWKQNLVHGRLELVAGMLDATDWLDLYALASPWTGFMNFAFATGAASIPIPDDATIGAYVNALLTDNLYIIGGLTDSNANSTDPFNGFDTFFNVNEYFTTIELGWTTASDRFYLDNTHITFWHADERVEAGVLSGWGANFSFAHAFDDKWMPFLRAGYAEDGGSLLQKTVSTGLGYHFGERNSLLGLGFNWGQPNEGTFGSGLDDQFTVELFTRLQVMRNLQVTPDIQYIKNPARNPDANQSWVFGLRARLVF